MTKALMNHLYYKRFKDNNTGSSSVLQRTKQVKTVDPGSNITISQKAKQKKQINEKIREIYTKVKHTMNGETSSYGYKLHRK